MKHLKVFKLFESSEEMTPEEFCEKHLPGSFGTSRYKIVNGEIVMDGDVHLFKKGLSYIPKFASVTGFIDVRSNNLKTFEFLPEECGGNYIINRNPYEGELKRIMDLVKNANDDGIKNIYKTLFNDFIKACIEYEVWYNGNSNEFGIKDAWHDVKWKHYNQNKDAFFYGKSELIELEDVEIVEDKFSIDTTSDNWVLELIEKLIGEIKSDDESNRRFYFLLLCNVIRNDEDSRVKEVIEGQYDLSEIYSRLDTFSKMQQADLDKVIKLVNKKLIRTDVERQRDQENDLFVFIGRDKFVEKEDGSYRKTLEIENFTKIDLYNPEDLQMVNMMTMRSRYQGGGSNVYMIWMPKDFFPKEKDSYMEEEIPEWALDLINQKKTRIG